MIVEVTIFWLTLLQKIKNAMNILYQYTVLKTDKRCFWNLKKVKETLDT